MEETKVSPSKQHPHGNTTPTMQRRYSFSRQATEAIEKGKQKSSPRKASSLSSMLVDNASPDYWSECRAEHEESVLEQAKPAPEVEAVPEPNSQSDDVSLMLDINSSSGRFSDDDSDGSSYSSVCSNEECSPTPSSTGSVTSSSPLLRREPSAAGFKTLHSEASEPSSLDSISRQDFPHEDEASGKVPPMSMFSFELSPKNNSSPKLNHKQQEENVADNDDDLPDWLLERVVLSPAVSTTKTSMRSPKQIEDEIRFAVDSAATRVQQELGRREQFQSELQSAAAFSATPTTADIQSATSKLFLSRGNDSEGLVQARDDPFSGRYEVEMEAITEQDIIMNEGEQGNLLLLMEVVIGDGRTETIEIHDGDNPDALASAFAQKHMLQPDAIPKLRGLIQEQINAAAEAEPEETIQAEQAITDEWAIDAEFDQYLNSSYTSTPAPVTTDTSHAIDSVNSPSTPQPEHARAPQQMHERENNREFNYNNLVARYGHYSQHSGKVDPEGSGARRYVSSDAPASHSAQAMNYTRTNERISASSTAPAFTTTINNSRSSNSKKKNNLADAPAYERLHALAESRNKWIQRAQKAKEIELARDQEKMLHVELMAAKSRELVANRTNGGYAHIGERLHDEALSDMAKKVQRHERRVVEREQQQDWMCPKCAYVNQHNDSRCQNIVALAEQKSKAHRGKSVNSGRRDTASSVNSSFGLLVSHPHVLCGQPKPERLFQPTLLTTSANVMKVVSGNQGKSSRVSSLRRQRHQNAVEKEFKQTCPFKPKINIVSEEIVREKLETAAAAAAVHGETKRPRNPHLALYEHSFQARAQREEREEEYFKQFPFKPDIGVNALWVSPDKSQSDFVERLAVDKYHELERKRVALHDKYAPDRDPLSGKELFKPEIGRAPAFARNKQGLPIGDFLHAAHREQQEYHRQLREKDQREIKKKSQQTFVSDASRQALERRKADTCKRIFDYLLVLSHQSASTGPEAGISSPTELSKQGEDDIVQQEENIELAIPARVDLSILPAEISQVVAIVFEYANHKPISRGAFWGYMDRLVREVPGITYSQIIFLAEHLQTDRGGRHRHLEADSEREAALLAAEEKELTFHPVIDKNSREIATKHGRVSGSKVFHALNQYYDHYLERKEQLRKQQQREFKKSHPFQPTLVTKAYQREPAATAFYDKIRIGNFDDSGNIASWRATDAVSSAAATHRTVGGSQPPPAPLQTAISNARPCVRPIESEHSKFYTAVMFDGPLLDDTARSLSRSSSSSQLLEDADLTSRVLAALDEKPTTTSPTSSSYHLKALALSDDSSVGDKVCSVRSPEDSTLTEPLYSEQWRAQ